MPELDILTSQTRPNLFESNEVDNAKSENYCRTPKPKCWAVVREVGEEWGKSNSTQQIDSRDDAQRCS